MGPSAVGMVSLKGNAQRLCQVPFTYLEPNSTRVSRYLNLMISGQGKTCCQSAKLKDPYPPKYDVGTSCAMVTLSMTGGSAIGAGTTLVARWRSGPSTATKVEKMHARPSRPI